jgi:hypothetical protein
MTGSVKEQDMQEQLFYPDVEPAELGQKMKPRKQKTIRASLKKVDKVQQSKIDPDLDAFIDV